jgi:hypothetical protein
VAVATLAATATATAAAVATLAAAAAAAAATAAFTLALAFALVLVMLVAAAVAFLVLAACGATATATLTAIATGDGDGSARTTEQAKDCEQGCETLLHKGWSPSSSGASHNSLLHLIELDRIRFSTAGTQPRRHRFETVRKLVLSWITHAYLYERRA